jgi:hypothetical protein
LSGKNVISVPLIWGLTCKLKLNMSWLLEIGLEKRKRIISLSRLVEGNLDKKKKNRNSIFEWLTEVLRNFGVRKNVIS